SAGGVPYLVMEYYEGGTLRDRIKKSIMNGAEAADMLRKVALGVAAAHQKSVIHRDIKPSNILMTRDGEDGEPRVGDFGIAIRSDREAQEAGDRCVNGTPGFMSPEQADGRALTTAADVHALGATLYYCLTGDTPYPGAGDPEWRERTVRGGA